MTPVTDERRAQTSKDDIDRDSNGQQKTGRVDVHPRECIDRRSASD